MGTMGLIDTHYHAKKQIKNKDLLHSKGNYVQYLVMNNYNEKEKRIRDIDSEIDKIESLCCTPRTITIL